jgi:epoxyqueuosine reductase
VKNALISRAIELGFDLCRVAKCTEPPHAEALDRWLDDGRAGEMNWMERNRERRVDPQKVLPGAKSVIVLALNYWQGAPRKKTAGRIARYAWGDDYHDVILQKLRKLDEFLAARGGTQRCYVDTGPVLERDFAALAGIGWHGKSTMLISRELGTWFFLAEIFTTLEIPADKPQTTHCGKCTRCIDACPTGAIDAAHHLDARRCISYLTIELKGSIPLEFRRLIGDRIYGCDDCLDVCPWNRFARESRESSFAAKRATTEMDLRDYLELTEADFRTIFKNSPIKRIKRRGFLRNVCVALGNCGNVSDLPALERAALDEEPLIAEHANWAIDEIKSRAAAEVAA